MQELKVPLFTTIFVLIAVSLFVLIFKAVPLSLNVVTTTNNTLFTATGTGEATAVPDTAQFTLGVTKTASTVQQAKEQMTQAANKIITDLKTLGVEDKNIKTVDYQVNPNYDTTSGAQITGYTVTQTLQVSITPIEKANQAVDKATADGANQVSSLIFTLTDAEKQQLEDKARSEAIQNAKQQAQKLASQTGVRLGRIINVQQGGGQTPFPYEAAALSTQGKAVDNRSTLTPGENTVTVTVILSYETL